MAGYDPALHIASAGRVFGLRGVRGFLVLPRGRAFAHFRPGRLWRPGDARVIFEKRRCDAVICRDGGVRIGAGFVGGGCGACGRRR